MNSTHPSRDPEFLSRLHDGDLTAGERAHFESHRAHCSECRRAAAEFEEALSLYRTSSTSPASPDLAARILRKLQAANRRRDPYGVVFGINLKWAGAFAVALIAMILGSSIVLRQQGSREAPASAAPKDAINVTLQSRDEQEALKKQTADLPAPRAVGEKKEGPANRANPQRHAPEPPAAAPPAESEKRALDLDRAQVASTSALESPVVQERAKISAMPQPTTREESGGEGNAPASPLLVMGEAGVLSPSIRITSLDGHGLPPDLLGPPPELSGELRGREYIIVVDIRGTVYDAIPHDLRRRARADDKAAAKSDEPQAAVPEALKQLRFKPTDRPRRLLLAIH